VTAAAWENNSLNERQLLLTALASIDAGEDGLHVVLALVTLDKTRGANTNTLVWRAPTGADISVGFQQPTTRGCNDRER
jgi:hypothetical protein